MKMYFYRGRRPNFGDELNIWLWPRLLPGFFDNDERELFIGTGSHAVRFPTTRVPEIVFGAGYGGYTAVPAIDKRLRFYFVRGRLTAAALGLDADLGVGDAALLVRSCVSLTARKVHKISVHAALGERGGWPMGGGQPRRRPPLHRPVRHGRKCPDPIQESEVLVAEAMHGAIVADALRVPWIAVRPIQPPNRAKWHDWASALDVTLRWERVAPSNALELAMSLTGRSKRHAGGIRARGQRLRAIGSSAFKELAARSLAGVASREPSLSSDAAIERAHTRHAPSVGPPEDRLRASAVRGRNVWA